MEDIKALTEKLESVEILLSAMLNTANDPKKKQEEAKALLDATESIKATSKELSGLISAEKGLIEGFKPVVEHRQYNVDFKKPLWWIVGAVAVVFIAFAVCERFYDRMETYRQLSVDRFDNDMKYRYMRLYGSNSTRKEMRSFSADYDQSDNWKGYAQRVAKREQELREAFEASKNAELQEKNARKANQEAQRLRDKADSLKGR